MVLEIAPEVVQRAEALRDLAAHTRPAAEPGDGGPTPEQAVRLAALDAGADEYLHASRNANTARAYAQDWASWTEFCAALDIPEVPATRGSLTGYVRWRWLAGHAPATIERSLSGIAAGHTERGVQIDRAATRQARAVLDAEIRAEAEAGQPPRGRGQAPPLTLPQLEAMLRACPDTPAGLRDRALLLVGLGIAARRGELASLRARHIVDLGDALRVTIPYGKRGGRTVIVSRGEHELTDPVQAWREWASVAELEPDEPALLQTTRWGGIRRSRAGMGDKAINDRVQACGERVGIEGLSAHTLRVSLATLSRQAGTRTEVIADQGGWMRDSRALLGYIRIVDELVENATVGIGL